MGYMGLASWDESDKASDLAHRAILAQVEVLREGLDVEENEFNTSGPENVGLFFEQFIVQSHCGVICDELYALAQDTSDALQERINASEDAEWYSEENKLMHIGAYKRMKKKIDQFIKEGTR